MPIRVPAATLKIVSKGAGRLSPDLVEGVKSFWWSIDTETGSLILNSKRSGGDRLKVWASNPKSKSKFIGLVVPLGFLGLDSRELIGKSYPVEVLGKGRFEVVFGGGQNGRPKTKNGSAGP